MFWKFSIERGWETNIAVGDTVNLANESVIFGKAKDCAALETNFRYSIQADFPT